MSRTFEESIPVLKLWFDSSESGMLLSHKGRTHNSHPTAEHYVEVYIKRDDLWNGVHTDPPSEGEITVKAADYVLARTGAFKLEIHSHEGKMTKLKLTRRL